MIKAIFIISILVSSVISVYYVPMKKDHELGEHICRYEINSTSNIYVKPCEEGKSCQRANPTTNLRTLNGWEYLYTCQNYTQKIFTLKQYDEDCESSHECDTGLTCIQGKCTKNCINDDQTAYRSDSSWDCTYKYLKENNYNYYHNFQDGSTLSYYSPYSKYPGTITFHKDTNNIYEIETIKNVDYASLDDGTFVDDANACKSGYYLYFYPDGSLNDPHSDNDGLHNELFKMCVSLEEINKYSNNKCQIIYSINNNGNKTYNLNQVPYSHLHDSSISTITDLINSLCSTDILQYKLLKKYIEAMTEEKRTKCSNLENHNYQTCNDDELTKWYYFYNHPDIYSLYYTDEDDDNYKYVVKHLIQLDYPYYQIGSILNFKNSIILLLLLLSLFI